MTYQVLARKWRPGTFAELVGQEHVVRALSNALESGRLHHAYLFTGTRGVGKTTLARIFAKSLNCDAGVGPTPCGRCPVCIAIDEGRFADLLEVDAASRTKVDQTRELLENVPYAPVQGRYKVYLIDEVHMFSRSSFNALLKTLEEPPPHVKFLLATTDPQKVPVTVLSRCLQFNLKRMPLEQITGYLEWVLKQEEVSFEAPALRLIARAADGSMRDALSLLDQAIAFGAGTLQEADVRSMLGSIDGEQIFRLTEALAAGDGGELMRQAGVLAERAPDFNGVLQELLYLLHRIALYLAVPDTLDRGTGDEEWVERLARQLAPEDVQLYYQIGLIGKRDMSLAPDPRSGFEMVLLRMLAFRPAAAPVASGGDTPSRRSVGDARPPAPQRAASPRNQAPSPPPHQTERHPPESAVDSPAEAGDKPLPVDPTQWRALIGRLRLGGVTRELANNCLFEGVEGDRLRLKLDPAHANLDTASTRERLLQGLRREFGEALTLELVKGQGESETPARLEALDRSRVQQQAEQSMAEDPLVQAFASTFDARLVPGSIKPREGLQE